MRGQTRFVVTSMKTGTALNPYSPEQSNGLMLLHDEKKIMITFSIIINDE